MVPEATRHLMNNNRNVDEFQQMFIISAAKANIGSMRAFRFFREIVGDYKSVGCTGNNFKNFVRDLKLGDGFKFFHEVDDEKKLCRIIWADDVSVKNYKLFGEAVSFDATYNTNRYNFIFTHFTGKDNHGRCISFAVALFNHEDSESYTWVLEKFELVMGNAPRIVITDQDPGLKKVVASTWKETRHRFCMWHINIKVAEKVPQRLRDDTDFKLAYDRVVWNDNDEPQVFEENWNNPMEEYDLTSTKWFSDMYQDRSMWIPAYFRDWS
ncbi:protein FAR1-RELATED SEQUENCE 5-like [Salvia miltiorrhiza]|uniref:protein FAR1-RELATED SEQUENCE 5-like n=1 Tax=Salvia miltiorrhiza TaxID=226208 RepID=UPI0025AD2ABC|nr:protein FAR1-RELATED SEQUENCE 5-like [Salvia miltiorrhiza]